MGGFINTAVTVLIGSAATLLLAGVAWLISRHYHHLPRNAAPWGLKVAIVLMLLAGALGPAAWMGSIMNFAGAQVGGAGGVIVALVALFLLLSVAVALFRHPTTKAMWLAFFLPIVCAGFGGGLFHNLTGLLAPLAQQVSGSLTAFLGA